MAARPQGRPWLRAAQKRSSSQKEHSPASLSLSRNLGRIGQPQDLMRTLADWLGSAVKPRRKFGKNFGSCEGRETKSPLPRGKWAFETSKFESVSLHHFLGFLANGIYSC